MRPPETAYDQRVPTLRDEENPRLGQENAKLTETTRNRALAYPLKAEPGPATSTETGHLTRCAGILALSHLRRVTERRVRHLASSLAFRLLAGLAPVIDGRPLGLPPSLVVVD